MVNKGTATDVNKSKPRTISVDDALWERVMAAKGERSVSEWMRSAMTDMLDGVDTGAVDDEFNRIKAERDAALKLAKAAETNVARLEADAVRIPPVPSVHPVPSTDALAGLEERIAERAEVFSLTPDKWVRGLVEYTLDRPIQTAPVAKGPSPDSDARAEAILEESARRQAAHIANGGRPWTISVSRFAHLKTAPKGSPNLTWKLGEEPGPPAWMTAPTTKEGMIGGLGGDAVWVAMGAARHVMSGKTD